MAESLHPFQRLSDTPLAYRLKWAAWEWLYTIGECRCIGMEVKLEGPGGRIVDLVGVGPENTVYILEVKTSRADFSRDNHTPDDLVGLRAKAPVVAGRTELARQTLAQATRYAQGVQPEGWQSVLVYRKALADYERLTREEKSYQARLTRYSIKFHDSAFLAIADYHYIIAPRGVIARRDMPAKWGLLDETLATVIPAPLKTVQKNTGIVSNILRAIARSNTTSMMRAEGVAFSQDGAVFPKNGLAP